VRSSPESDRTNMELTLVGALAGLLITSMPTPPEIRERLTVLTGSQHESSARPAEGADKLAVAVMQRFADRFARERSGLEKQRESGDNLSS
jgi:hypothetical protein